MTDLVTFLSARLDEDEQIARACSPGPWEQIGNRVIDAAPISTELGLGMAVGHAAASSTNRDDAAHIARHDPACVLADVTAKRAILAAYTEADEMASRTVGVGAVSDVVDAMASAFRTAVRVLASVHADHPDFDETWRIDVSAAAVREHDV